jgi:hypothetical protein
MAQQWIKLSVGWLDLGRVAFMADTPVGGLALYDTFGTNAGPARYLDEADAAAVRDYLDKVGVKPLSPRPATGDAPGGDAAPAPAEASTDTDEIMKRG